LNPKKKSKESPLFSFKFIFKNLMIKFPDIKTGARLNTIRFITTGKNLP
jgi:hypothetical protein